MLADGLPDLVLQSQGQFVAHLAAVDFVPGRGRESIRAQRCSADSWLLLLDRGGRVIGDTRRACLRSSEHIKSIHSRG